LVLGILVVMTLLIILAATWVSFYLARGFVTPIESLADGTRRVSQGELGYQVEGSSLGPLQGDFDELVQSFNLMSRQLKEQRHQLVETTENLQQSHHELGERTRLVELLLENIDAGIVSLDPQGRITSANRAARRLAQPRGDSWLGAHYRIALGKKFVALLDEMRERLLGDAERHLTQNLTVTQNRKPVHIEVTLLSLENKEGISEGTVVILKDVTAMQRNQRALAWQEVARRVAHEIKNPLTPIQLSAQRIRRKYLHNGGGEDGILDQSTQTIIREVTSLKKMVNEFSHFAQLPESQPVPGDLNKVIREVAGLYESGLPEHVQIDLKLEPNLPPLPLDREQMKRVFSNLIDNAVASLPASRRGRITISTALNPEANTIVVEVIDDGTGVPEEVRDRLFEPYATSKEGGTGLGLTIVNQIVSDHFGYIRYSERKPRGSVFSIELQPR
ncbi:MAG: PAS domain-containing protein, partial [SAR324 cluster bacterium]|nr:PAS domain-containing protein [SAR324 cluster bacterium]